MQKLLLSLYDFFQGRKLLFYGITVLLFSVLGFLAAHIKIEEDIAKMMPNGKQATQINSIFRHSKFADKIVVKIAAKNETTPEQLIEFADSFEAQLNSNYKDYIAEIKSKVSDETTFDIYNTVHDNLPIYLEEKDYKTIDTLIASESIRSKLESDYKVLTSASGLVLKKLIADDPVGISTIALKKLQSLQIEDNYELYDGYILSKDRKNLVIFITPTNSPNETAKNQILIEGIDKTIASLQSKTQNIDAFYYGGTAVAVCNAQQLKRDTILTLSITIISLLLFIGFFFKRKRIPVVMFLPVLFGALFSIAIIYLWQGNISSIAIAAGSIVLGIAINYSLHFFGHYKHCGSIKETIADLLMPMTIGSFTTVGSFFSLMLVKSQILSDFGLFAGLSLMGAALFSLIFLPHFIPLQKEKNQNAETENWLERLLSFQFKSNGYLVLAIFALTFFFYHFAKNIGFESDMMKLNFMTPKLSTAEHEINELQGGDSSKTVYIATVGNTLEEVLSNNEKLLVSLDKSVENGWVKKYSSISHFIISKKLQQERINRWNNYWSNAKKKQLISSLQREGVAFTFKPEAFNNFSGLLNKTYETQDEKGFESFQKSFGSDYRIDSKDLQAVINAVKVDKSQRTKLYSYLQQNPSTVILDKQIVTNKFIEIIYSDFNSILLYTSLLVFFALLLSYGRLELTIVTFLPMLITWIWILGIMSLFGLKFNIINIIISTFIFGIGDDFSIFITDGLTKKFAEGKETIQSHKTSIFLSAITTIIGLGALIFAKHPALKSIAFISIIGIFCVLIIGQTIQPFLYDLFIQKRKEKHLAPYTFLTLITTIIDYSFFCVGSIFVAIIGFFIIKALPFPRIKTRKFWFHKLIQLCVKATVYIPFYVRKVHIGRDEIDFSKPSIIIANHSSMLDILTTVMQHPKIILLTNKWVYHSPVFGKVVQLADYYPVMEGADPAIEKLKEIVEDGYSIVIFPEGTRSKDGAIHRFHKGAFYLAEKLQLDIVPLLLHGHSNVIPKGDFQVFPGQMTMKFLPRITPHDKNFGEDYAERTKLISRYFKEEFSKLKQEIEQPKYFRERLTSNYIYKGPVLEWYTREKIRIEKYYETYHLALPKSGTITDLGCGYGYMAYMLQFLSKGRKIKGVDYDEAKIDVANNCYSKTENLHFETASVVDCSLENQDAFIINDVLHYLTYEEQETVISRCIEKLNQNGIIIIKDADRNDQKGHKLTWLTEFLSTNFGFNKMGHEQLYFTTAEEIKRIAEKYGMHFSILEEAQYSSNTIFAIRHT